MKLYEFPPSPNARRATIVIEECGLQESVERVHLDMLKGETRSPDYLALNPAGKVPTLVHDDLVLTESRAIMKYLAAHASSPLWPTEPRDQATVDQWLFWDAIHFGRPVETLIGEKLLKAMTGGTPDEAAVEKAMGGFREQGKLLDAHLAERAFVLGDAPSLADLSLGATLTYEKQVGAPVDELPNVRRWLDALTERPSFQATAPQL